MLTLPVISTHTGTYRGCKEYLDIFKENDIYIVTTGTFHSVEAVDAVLTYGMAALHPDFKLGSNYSQLWDETPGAAKWKLEILVRVFSLTILQQLIECCLSLRITIISSMPMV